MFTDRLTALLLLCRLGYAGPHANGFRSMTSQ
jgi:hypothetical protein